MIDEKMARINALAALAKSRPLTDAELAEQKALREEYIAGFRNSLTQQLDNVYFVDEAGQREKLKKR